MTHQLRDLLKVWQQAKHQTEWVLGTLYKTEGSAYRKAGAMMLINSLGQHVGLLSGGCLEADIVREARKCLHDNKVRMLAYDNNDEDDWSYQLNLGCGGKIFIMLQPLTGDTDLGLEAMLAALENRTGGRYLQRIDAMESRFEPDERRYTCHCNTNHWNAGHSTIETRDDGDWLITAIHPEPHLLVAGGGVDARPLVAMAGTMGWQVTVADPRPTNARADHFPAASRILKHLNSGLSDYIDQQRVDAVVIMTHNLTLDAAALTFCQSTRIKHLALLGPRHRYEQILKHAALTEKQLSCAVSSPAGLDIGGQLPESIALSILSECHAVLYQTALHQTQHPSSLASALSG